MLFSNLKSLVLYGLLAVATATPLLTAPHDNHPSTHLSARMTKKKGASHSYMTLDKHVIPQEEVAKALGEVRRRIATGQKKGKYPAPFSNKATNHGHARKVFANKDMGKDANLLEWPMPRKSSRSPPSYIGATCLILELEPGEGFPGSVRLVVTAGATPNVVGLMQHPPSSDSGFEVLEVAKTKSDTSASCKTTGEESSTAGAKKGNAARSLWELVRRKVKGKAGGQQGAACALKPKGKTPGAEKGGMRGGKTKGTGAGRKKKGSGKKVHRKAHKKTAGKKRPGRKRPAKRPARKHARPARKGGRRGGRRGGRV